jgi:hypothetical protein
MPYENPYRSSLNLRAVQASSGFGLLYSHLLSEKERQYAQLGMEVWLGSCEAKLRSFHHLGGFSWLPWKFEKLTLATARFAVSWHLPHLLKTEISTAHQKVSDRCRGRTCTICCGVLASTSCSLVRLVEFTDIMLFPHIIMADTT